MAAGASSVEQRTGEGAGLGHWVVWAWAERTQNMADMSVTREISKLSGWLKALAPCRESKGGHTVQAGREVRGPRGERRRGGGGGVAGARAACARGRGPELGTGWWKHGRSAPKTCRTCR